MALSRKLKIAANHIAMGRTAASAASAADLTAEYIYSRKKDPEFRAYVDECFDKHILPLWREYLLGFEEDVKWQNALRDNPKAPENVVYNITRDRIAYVNKLLLTIGLEGDLASYEAAIAKSDEMLKKWMEGKDGKDSQDED